ncbi:hypothetical protein [Pseudopelagicola sp. nBUS_19]|uniref:hypothetical protein n=1 Tax=Pseudopelagicola sp. nBUS_19 TaxID=3395316 RepID=UPI003EB8331F
MDIASYHASRKQVGRPAKLMSSVLADDLVEKVVVVPAVLNHSKVWASFDLTGKVEAYDTNRPPTARKTVESDAVSEFNSYNEVILWCHPTGASVGAGPYGSNLIIKHAYGRCMRCTMCVEPGRVAALFPNSV